MKDEILNEIYRVCSPNLEKTGFYPNKNKEIYSKKKNDFKYIIEIKISDGKRQHITLKIQHKKINEIFKNTIFEAVKRNNEMVIPKGIVSVCSLTDWKELYNSNNLKFGNIWFSTISNLKIIKNRKNEYDQAFLIANNWFESNSDMNYLYEYNFNNKYTYNIEIALCIGYYLKKDIMSDYSNFKTKSKDAGSWNKERIDTFIECLLEAV